jgi:hypothetical protein
MATHVSIIMLIRPDANAPGSTPGEWVDVKSVLVLETGGWEMTARCGCAATQRGWVRCWSHEQADSLFVHSQLPFRIAPT